MARRGRYVRPDRTRLYLADVYRRTLENLKTIGVTISENGTDKVRPATAEEIAEAAANLREAETDADWVDVKRELNAGETQEIFTNLVKDFTAGQQAKLDPKKVGLTKILQYLLAWSFLDEDGQPLPFNHRTMSEDERLAMIKGLDKDSYRDLNAAIDWWDSETERLRRERKNDRSTSVDLSPTSTSVG